MGVISISVLLWKVCNVKYVCSRWILSGYSGDLVCSPIVQLLKTSFKCFGSDSCMFSLWVRLTVYKQCYGVTFMNSFSFFSSCFMILWANSFLYSSQKAGILLPWAATYFPWFSLHLGTLKKKKRRKRKGYIEERAIETFLILFGRQFVLSYEDHVCSNFSLTGPIFCHCWCHHCWLLQA